MITNELGNRTASIINNHQWTLKRANRESEFEPKRRRRGMPDRVFRI
jgi:hypothetical protein